MIEQRGLFRSMGKIFPFLKFSEARAKTGKIFRRRKSCQGDAFLETIVRLRSLSFGVTVFGIIITAKTGAGGGNRTLVTSLEG